MKNTGITLLVVCAAIFFSFNEKKPCITVNEIKVKAPVSLKNITTGTVQEKKHIHENVKGFVEK